MHTRPATPAEASPPLAPLAPDTSRTTIGDHAKLTDAIYERRYTGMGYNELDNGVHYGAVKALALREMTFRTGAGEHKGPLYDSGRLRNVAQSYTTVNESDPGDIRAWEDHCIGTLLLNAEFSDKEAEDAAVAQIRGDLRGLVRLGIVNPIESDTAEKFGQEIEHYRDLQETIADARAQYKSHPLAKRAFTAALSRAKRILGAPGTLATHMLVRWTTRDNKLASTYDVESMHNVRRAAQALALGVLTVAGGALVVWKGNEAIKNIAEGLKNTFDGSDPSANSAVGSLPTSGSGSPSAAPQPTPSPAETPSPSKPPVPGAENKIGGTIQKPEAGAGNKIDLANIRDTIELGMLDPTKEYEVKLPKWDAKTGEGSAWVELIGQKDGEGVKAGLANFLGFDNLTPEQKDELVDRVLEYNNMSWDDAKGIDSFKMPPQNTISEWLREMGATYDAANDESLLVHSKGTSGANSPTSPPSTNNPIEDNTFAGSLERGDGPKFSFEKDGDIKLEVGNIKADINTTAPHDMTPREYIAYLNGQLPEQLKMDNTEMDSLATNIANNPNLQETLGIKPDGKIPAGNLSVSSAFGLGGALTDTELFNVSPPPTPTSANNTNSDPKYPPLLLQATAVTLPMLILSEAYTQAIDDYGREKKRAKPDKSTPKTPGTKPGVSEFGPRPSDAPVYRTSRPGEVL